MGQPQEQAKMEVSPMGTHKYKDQPFPVSPSYPGLCALSHLRSTIQATDLMPTPGDNEGWLP